MSANMRKRNKNQPKQPQKFLTTSQLARQLRLPVSTVKKYCEYGVLRFQRKSRNSYRLFVLKAAKEDIYLINRLKAMGLSMNQIRVGRCVGIVHKSSLEQALNRLNKRRQVARRRLKIGAQTG